MKKYFFLLVIILSAGNLFAQSVAIDEVRLRREAAQMLIVGFRGTTVSPKDPIFKDIESFGVGGVILFEYDAPSKSRPRNIESKAQLARLISELQQLSKNSLFISIDQEGGKVNRLKPQYGFPDFVSAGYLGKLDNEDSTRYWAKKTTETLSELGFNLNFAPCVDLNINPQCPVIGKLDRSFSDSPEKVVKHAAIWIEEQRKKNIYSAVKHFPGHGSSQTDTHLQFTDITSTWKAIELEPYRMLIAKKKCDFIMTSHVVNRNLDSVPATMSRKILTDVLRSELGFEGIIISDDMDMGAIRQNYSLSEMLEKSIHAGVDMLIFSNNGAKYDPLIIRTILDTIVELAKAGKISPAKITESYQKVMKYKST